MADDIRQNDAGSASVLQDSTSSSDTSIPRRPRRERPKDFPESQASKMWKAFGNPNEPVNEMPGGMANSAEGRHLKREPTWRDAFNFSFLTSNSQNPNAPNFYQQPCARDSLLVGIGSGGAMGGLRFILRGMSGMIMTTNYAVGTFAIASCGMFYWCQSRRREEAKGMAAAVAGMKMLHEKKAREEVEEKRQKEEMERRAKEEQERIRREKSWWKVW